MKALSQLLPLFVGAVALALAPRACAGGVIYLHVLAGQSNAVGQKGNGALYPVDAASQDAGIPFWNVLAGVGVEEGKWAPLGPRPGLFTAGYFGPEVTYIRSIAAHDHEAVAMYKFARGSSSIARFWKTPGAGGGYDKMVADLKKAVAALEKSTGKTVRIASLVWIQGESDATKDFASQYQERLQAIIVDFRAHVAGDPQLPVVLGVDEQHSYVKQFPIVVTAQENIARGDPRCRRTSMIGLAKADGTHLTPAGLGEHGKRLAAAYRMIVP